IQSPVVVSGCDPAVTFLHLIDPAVLPAEFVEAVRRIDYSSASLKINVALSELPDFRALPGAHPAPQHRGTIHSAATIDYTESAYDDVKYDRPARNPVIEAPIP